MLKHTLIAAAFLVAVATSAFAAEELSDSELDTVTAGKIVVSVHSTDSNGVTSGYSMPLRDFVKERQWKNLNEGDSVTLTRVRGR